MNDAVLGTIAAAGFSVAFVHAALPTHWLPFVLAGRRQRWPNSRTMAVTALAGGGHVLFTIVLGLLVVWLGIAVDQWTGSIFPWIASGVLVAFGLYFWLHGDHDHHLFGGHSHGHHGHDHDHGDHGHLDPHRHPKAPLQAGVEFTAPRTDRAVILGLIAALTFSPCEGFLPVFVAGVKSGWFGFAVLSAILAVATLAGMVLLTWLTLHGLQHFNLEKLDRYEGRIAGGLLIGLGVAVAVLET